jgi:hypothetical protein
MDTDPIMSPRASMHNINDIIYHSLARYYRFTCSGMNDPDIMAIESDQLHIRKLFSLQWPPSVRTPATTLG